MSFQHVLQAALQLSPTERSQLAELLDASLDEPKELSQEWRDEIERRSQQIDSGEDQGVPWEVVRES